MRCILALIPLAALILIPTPARAEPAPPRVPAGFQVAPAIPNVHHPTRLVFGPDGRLYVAQQTGEVFAVTLKDGQETGRQLVAKATPNMNLLGIALKGDQLWLSENGKIARLTRHADGTYGDRREIVKGIPFALHQNDGFAWGPDGKLYFGVGSTTDRGPEEHAWSGTVMRMNPDGAGLEVYAKGFRNPYGIAFDPEGQLWVTDNGSDNPASPDELNRVAQGGDYGFPKVFGMPPAGSATRAPVVLFGDHNSTDGLAFYTGDRFPKRYQGGIFVAMWGGSDDDTIGRAVGFVQLTRDGGSYKAAVEEFATGFNRPLDVAMGPQGDLWVADFFGQTVYRIWYTSPGAVPPSAATPPSPAPTPAPASPATAPVPTPPSADLLITLEDHPQRSVLLFAPFMGLFLFMIFLGVAYRKEGRRRWRLLVLGVIAGCAVAVWASLRLDVDTSVRVSDTTVTLTHYRRPNDEIPLNTIVTVEEVWQRETVLRLVTQSQQRYTLNVSGPLARRIEEAITQRTGLHPDGENRWTR